MCNVRNKINKTLSTIFKFRFNNTRVFFYSVNIKLYVRKKSVYKEEAFISLLRFYICRPKLLITIRLV